MKQFIYVTVDKIYIYKQKLMICGLKKSAGQLVKIDLINV